MHSAWQNRGRSFVCQLGLLTLAVVTTLSGCGGADTDQKATTKVTGKVTHDGKPVTGGTLLFAPIADEKNKMPGKDGQAVIKSDGTYEVSTYNPGDGAVIGNHRLTYVPPAAEMDAHGQPKGDQPFKGLVPSKETVEVAKGAGPIEIELVAPK